MKKRYFSRLFHYSSGFNEIRPQYFLIFILLNTFTLTQKAYSLLALAASNNKKHIFTPHTRTTHEGIFLGPVSN